MLLVCLVILFETLQSECACTYPTQLQFSTWIDSYKGQYEFTNTGMFGYEFDTFWGHYDGGWDCHLSSNDGLTLVLRSKNTITLFSTQMYALLCMEMTKVNDFSYRYILNSDKQQNANDERIAMAGVTDVIDDTRLVCKSSNSIPETEYHVMIKSGFENSAKTTCPLPFLGLFHYTFNDGTDQCGSGTERWDACSDKSTMVFNYTLCPARLLYSESGSVFCVSQFESGSQYFTTVYNTDVSVDESTTFRFSCLVVTVSGSNTVASQIPNECVDGQTATAVPSPGALLVLTPYYTCRPEDETTTAANVTETTLADDTTVDVGVIAGASLGALALLALILLAFLYFCTGCCVKSGEKDQENILDTDEEEIQMPVTYVESHKHPPTVTTLPVVPRLENRQGQIEKMAVYPLPVLGILKDPDMAGSANYTFAGFSEPKLKKDKNDLELTHPKPDLLTKTHRQSLPPDRNTFVFIPTEKRKIKKNTNSFSGMVENSKSRRKSEKMKQPDTYSETRSQYERNAIRSKRQELKSHLKREERKRRRQQRKLEKSPETRNTSPISVKIEEESVYAYIPPPTRVPRGHSDGISRRSRDKSRSHGQDFVDNKPEKLVHAFERTETTIVSVPKMPPPTRAYSDGISRRSRDKSRSHRDIVDTKPEKRIDAFERTEPISIPKMPAEETWVSDSSHTESVRQFDLKPQTPKHPIPNLESLNPVHTSARPLPDITSQVFVPDMKSHRRARPKIVKKETKSKPLSRPKPKKKGRASRKVDIFDILSKTRSTCTRRTY